MGRSKNNSRMPRDNPVAKMNRRDTKRREAIENRVATNRLQKQINKKSGSKTVVVHENAISDTRGQNRPSVTPEMVADFRIKAIVDKLSAMLPSARKLRNAAFVQSMGAKSGGVFALQALHAPPLQRLQQQKKMSGTVPWLQNNDSGISLNDELHKFCEYVQVLLIILHCVLCC